MRFLWSRLKQKTHGEKKGIMNKGQNKQQSQIRSAKGPIGIII